MKYVLVPMMLFVSSCLMALAWLGHLKFKNSPLYVAILLSWCIVLPEYVLNVLAIRYGHGTFSGAAMATFNLCTGVICVALVSAYYLKEPLKAHQIVGFALLAVSMGLVAWSSGSAPAKDEREDQAQEEPAGTQETPAVVLATGSGGVVVEDALFLSRDPEPSPGSSDVRTRSAEEPRGGAAGASLSRRLPGESSTGMPADPPGPESTR